MRKRLLILSAILILFMIMLISDSGTNGDLKNPLTVGLDDSPLGYLDERGEIVGFEVDMAREAIKRAGSTAEFKIIHWSEKEKKLDSGEIDMIWSGMDITPERQEKMIFCKQYMNNFMLILVHEGNPHNILSDIDFRGHKVGVKAGTTAENYIMSNTSAKNFIKELKTYDRDEEVFMALKNGEIDAIVSNELIARYLMAKHGYNFDVSKILIESHECGVGFRKDDKELRDAIQKAYDSMVTDGTAKKISEKWFQADLSRR